MNKRDFLKHTALVAGAAMFAPTVLTSCQPGSPKVRNWIWTSVNTELSDSEWIERFKALVSYGITGILFGGEDERIYRLAQEHGLETHCWMWTLNRGDQEIREQHPEWYSVNRLGESCLDHPPYVDYYRWLCPSRPEVLDFLKNQVNELAAKPHVQGVHLDYVRYCDVILPKALWEKYDLVQHEELPQFDYCYCSVCQEKFEQEQGVNPLELPDPPSHQPWLQFRYDSVTRIVNALSKEVHQHNKLISAAVFPSPAIAKRLVRQDWTRWNLDLIFPMVYQSFYEEDIPWVGKTVAAGTEALEGRYPLFAGLYLPALPEPADLVAATRQARENGALGVSLFGKVSEAHWEAFSEMSDNQIHSK